MTDIPPAKTTSARRKIAYVLLILVLAGAAGAAYVNRDQFIEAWTGKRKPSGVVLSESDAAKKTGSFDLRLDTRSPASAADAVQSRCGLKPDRYAAYKIADRKFAAYVPASPAADGRYGVIVGLCFAPYAQPPQNWLAVLEKRHLIWIGPYDSDNSQPGVMRIGLILDAADGAKRIWPVDPSRIYLSSGTSTGPAAQTAFYYPDVFAGMVSVPVGLKFDEQAPMPAMAQLNTDRHDRWYAIDLRIPAGQPADTSRSDAYNAYYRRLGFEHVMAVDVPESKMGHYAEYGGDWFDSALEWVESRHDQRTSVRSLP